MTLRRLATVRARVTALAALVVLMVLVAAGLLLVAQQRRVLTEALDEGLVERADDLLALGPEAPPVLTGLGEDDALAQVVVRGAVVSASENAAGLGPVAAAPSDRRRTRTIGGLPHETSRFRLVSQRSADGAVVVHVAGSLDDIDESVATLVRSLIAVVPFVVSAVGAVVWWLAGRTLSPVEAIRAEVAGIEGGDRGRRVPVPPGDDEVARLARTMNDMLARLDEAAARQQRFLADASHELRSPLTRIRSELEVDLAHPGTADPVATHRSILEEAESMQRLVEDLLLVARSEGVELLRADRCDLGAVVRSVAAQLPGRRGVTVDLGAVGSVAVHGDRAQLGRLVRNLADNALRHARRRVAIEVRAVDGRATLVVRDDGPGVPAADRERVFERFARLDEARGAGGGTGLGLAIARDIAERHGGTLTLADAEPGSTGAVLVLTLPGI